MGFVVKWAGRIEHQGVDGLVEIGPERGSQFPVAGHAAPERIDGHEIARRETGEGVPQGSGPQGAHGEGFDRAAEERCAGIENRAVHHLLTRTADHQAWRGLGTVEPVLDDADNARIGGDQVRQLVEDERTRPLRLPGVAPQALEERAPIGVFDVVEPGESFRHSRSQIPPLHRRCRRVGNGIEPVVALRPFDEQARLAYPSASPDDAKGTRLLERRVQTSHLFVTVQELHPIIMRQHIMLDSIIMRPCRMAPTPGPMPPGRTPQP